MWTASCVPNSPQRRLAALEEGTLVSTRKRRRLSPPSGPSRLALVSFNRNVAGILREALSYPGARLFSCPIAVRQSSKVWRNGQPGFSAFNTLLGVGSCDQLNSELVSTYFAQFQSRLAGIFVTPGVIQ